MPDFSPQSGQQGRDNSLINSGPIVGCGRTSGAIVTESRTTHGAFWFDYDNDGFPDSFIAGAVYEGGSPNILFRNEKDGAWADFDRDGYLDLFAVNRDGPNTLYRSGGVAPFCQPWLSSDELLPDG